MAPAQRRDGAGEPARHAPLAAVLYRTRALLTRTLARGAGAAAIRLLSVRRRLAQVHRRSVRVDRSANSTRSDGAAVPFCARRSASRRATGTDHYAASER